jgi:hypothetical protein
LKQSTPEIRIAEAMLSGSTRIPFPTPKTSADAIRSLAADNIQKSAA